MRSAATTVEQYIAELPDDRREAIQAVRDVIRSNLPSGYEEGMQYGMIGYYVPHSVYPPGYHCDPKQPLPFAGLASQKNHMAVYLFCIYGDPEQAAWFRQAWDKTGKRLDMGKSCVRFKKLEALPLDVVGQAIKRTPVTKFVAWYESAIQSAGKRPRGSAASKKKAAAKPTAKKATGKNRGVAGTATDKTAANATPNTKKATSTKKQAAKRSTAKK